jgi:hypothetical protein
LHPAAMAPIPVDVKPDLLDWATAVGTAGAVLVALGVAVFEARRARRAEEERDSLIRAGQQEARRATARRVTAWIEESFAPVEDGTHYLHRATAHLLNESDEPVFQLGASVILSSPFEGESLHDVILGPLSIPQLIPVLAPKRELIYDLSTPLMAHRDEAQSALTETPRIIVSFTDPNDVRWTREADGRLVESTREPGNLFATDDDEGARRQIGGIHALNPMAVAMGFLSAIRDEASPLEESLDRVRTFLAPEAEGWRSLDISAIAQLRGQLTDYNLGGHVLYPVPNVAYVRLVGSDSTELMVAQGEGLLISARIMTLILDPEVGWKVFSFGGSGTRPDRIFFNGGMRS